MNSSKGKEGPGTGRPAKIQPSNMPVTGGAEGFQFVVDVKGFPKENIHIRTDGPTVTIECDQAIKREIITETPATEVARTGQKEQIISRQTAEKTIQKTTALPPGTDPNTVQINLDMVKGVVVITGDYSLSPQPNSPKTASNALHALTFDKDLFKLTVAVKGFRQENIKVKRDGQRVNIDCRQVEEPSSTSNSSPPVKFTEANKKVERESQSQTTSESTRVFHFSTLLPEGTDLNSVNTQIDTTAGLVIITGRALPN